MNYDALYAHIKKSEDFKSKMYRCPAGHWTIGYGFNLEEHSISEKIAELLLDQVVEIAEADVHSIFPAFDTYSDNRQLALTDMCYNLGKSRFLKFQRLIDAVKDQRWSDAAEEMKYSRWYGQVGGRAETLVKLMQEG